MSRVALGAVLALLTCLVPACASTPEAEAPPTVAACADSAKDGACDNGQPLCMMDEERACRFCRCSTYALGEPRRTPDMGPHDQGFPNDQTYLAPTLR